MRRVVVVGCGGAGKTTFALELGRALDLPVVHLDRFYWRPGWEPTPSGEWPAILEAALSGDRWIADGNYFSTLAWRASVADTVVFLDVPRRVCLARAVRRALTTRHRPDMADGCRERIDPGFLRWIWRFPTRDRPRLLAALERAARAGKVVHHLRGGTEIRRFLNESAR